MVRRLLQIIAFLFPPPINVWLHRLAGAKIDKYVLIYPGVVILAKNIEIGREARIKSGTVISVRTFKLGRKGSIGFMTHVKGVADLIIGDCSIIGPKTMIDCTESVTVGFYSGVGPDSCLYTHGSGMPVTEGHRATFGPIHIKDKVWVSMRCIIGPGVTIEEGSLVMPGTVLVESIASKRLVAGNPAKLNNFPVFLTPQKTGFLEELAPKILEDYCKWSNEYKGTNWKIEEGILKINRMNRNVSISAVGDGDIVILTTPGETRNSMYFNLADLSTDKSRHPEKLKLEAFLRLYYGLIFL